MFQQIDLYGWYDMLTPELIVVAISIVLLYSKAGNIQPINGTFVPISWTRQALFYTGVICMYFGYGGILSLLAKESVDVYVLQLCIRYMCMIPLLISGIPTWIRKGIISRLPGGQKFLESKNLGMYAALFFLLSLSVILLPSVHHTLLTMVFIRILVHLLLFVSAWFMWESFFLPELNRYQREKYRIKLMVLGSALLFPICLMMIGTDYTIFPYSQRLLIGLCVPPSANWLSIVNPISSTSIFGGIFLMATLQISIALTNRVP